ncbi:MAG: hypothetical protein P4L22_02800 [Candidatus Babeliales bacterium]|nr:hypothetical protein [Candidatus Babeliales bacterium]
MVKYSLKQIGFLLAIFFCFSLKAEYILYKTNNQNEISALTQEEHDQSYKILIKYQFPTCLCYQDQIKLTKEEDELYKKSEEEFIQTKLPENIKIKFVPTVIYELLFYNFYLESKFTLKTSFIPVLYKECLKKNNIGETSCWDYKRYLIAMAKFNEDKNIIDIHYKINIFILFYLKNNNLFDKKNLISIISSLIKNINNMFDIINCKRLLVFQYGAYFQEDRVNLSKIDKKDIDFFEQVALVEYNAHMLGDILLFRGTGGNDSTRNHRLSYGCSFLTGLLRDYSACPYYYFSRKKIGYALHVNKYKYINRANCYQLFFIPPLNTLMILSLAGELFHVSSRIKNNVNISYSGVITECFSGITNAREFSIDAITRLCRSTEEEFEKKFQDYLNENVVYIKNGAGLQIQSKL